MTRGSESNSQCKAQRPMKTNWTKGKNIVLVPVCPGIEMSQGKGPLSHSDPEALSLISVFEAKKEIP